ncbi:hypothetical protein RB195_024902 [Necator americanus]|uniref:Ras family protein n=1 Tax=Necator americanus TaxID=51031 RepID=A0ABR1EQM2_NECAM
MSYNHLFKIVVVGDHNCGKSCMLLRFAENTFRMDHLSTIGVDFKLKTIKLGRDKIRLELWDTAGMERYRTIYNSYYHSAHGVMCVYDMTNEKSFSSLESYWLKQIKEHAPQNSVLMLVGNKADLGDERKILRWPVFTGRAGPRISSTRFAPSPLSSKMFSSFVSDVDEVLAPYPAELSAGPSVQRTRHPISLAVSLGGV